MTPGSTRFKRRSGDAQAIVLLEPDALANLPGYCGSTYNTAFPNITNTTRIEDVAYGVQTLESDPNISVYLDAGHSAWQAVGNIAEVLVAADVQQAQGFFLNVSNYQYATNNAYYGSWVSSCIAYATQLSGETQTSAIGYAPQPDLRRQQSQRSLRQLPQPVLERRTGEQLERHRDESVRRLERDPEQPER